MEMVCLLHDFSLAKVTGTSSVCLLHDFALAKVTGTSSAT
jgi:hypothetical protein